MDTHECLEAYVRVAERLSVSRAAEELGVSKSAISKRIKYLEDRVGTPLFQRNTHSLTLTEAGRSCYERAVHAVEQTRAALDLLNEQNGQAAGVLSVHLPDWFQFNEPRRHLAEFAALHPDIRLNLEFGTDEADLLKCGFDCAVQSRVQAEASVIARPLLRVRSVLVAAPAYLKQEAYPETPADLKTHRVTTFGRGRGGTTLSIWNEAGWQSSALDNVISCNSYSVMLDLALGGHCVACLPSVVAAPMILSRSLTPVLPEFALPAQTFNLYFTHHQRSVRRVRVFTEYLEARFNEGNDWDEALIGIGALHPMVIGDDDA